MGGKASVEKKTEDALIDSGVASVPYHSVHLDNSEAWQEELSTRGQISNDSG